MRPTTKYDVKITMENGEVEKDSLYCDDRQELEDVINMIYPNNSSYEILDETPVGRNNDEPSQGYDSK